MSLRFVGILAALAATNWALAVTEWPPARAEAARAVTEWPPAGAAAAQAQSNPRGSVPEPDSTPLVWVATRLNDEAWVVDPSTDRVVAQVRPRRGTAPQDIAASDDAVWMIDGSGWVHRMDPSTREVVASVRGPTWPHAVAASPAGVWVAAGDGWVRRLDPATNAFADSVEIVAGIHDLAYHSGSLWVGSDSRDGELKRVEPGASVVSDSVALDWTPVALASDGETLWAHDPFEGVVFALGADGVRGPFDLGSRVYEGLGLGVGLGAVWVSLGTANAVARVDATTGSVRRIDVGGFVPDLAVGAGAVWAVLPETEELVRIDPDSDAVVARITVEGFPHAVTVR